MNNYIFTDIHGSGELFDKVLNFLDKNPGTTLYFLGDACDRGADGYRIIKHMLNDSRFVYLKGNHEDLFVKSARQLRELIREEGLEKERFTEEEARDIIYNYCYFDAIALHLGNGGAKTLIDWLVDGMNMKIINQLDKLPLKFDYINFEGYHIEMSHAGHLMGSNDYLWSRDHFFEKYTEGIMIHGHTGVKHLNRKGVPTIKGQPAKYAEGTKIDLDVTTIESKKIWLLNPDTFIEICLEISDE